MPAAALDPPFSQARRDMLRAIEQRVVGCHFSDAWIDYLDMLPAVVRDCRRPGVHLIDPLAIPRERLIAFAIDIGLNAYTAAGLGLLGDRTDPNDPSASSLHRYLPLSLGYEGYRVDFCYHDRESIETPVRLFRIDQQLTINAHVCDEWILELIQINRGYLMFASPFDTTDMLIFFNELT
jgi:hypothetical protein